MASQQSLLGTLGRGHHDDGREGIVLAKIAAGQLVKVPFGTGSNNTGGLAHVIGSSTVGPQSQITYNPDGSGSALNISVPTGLGQGSCWTEVVYGSIVGVRFMRTNVSTLQPFGVVIDGVAYTVRNTRHHHDSVQVTANDAECLVIVADDLPDTAHTVRVIVPSDPYGGTTRTLTGFGWLLEASRGYKETVSRGAIGTGALLSTTTTALSASSIYRAIRLNNTDSVARVVTFKNGSTVLEKVYLAASGTDGDSKTIDLKVSMPGISTFTLQADAAAVVVWIPIFGEGR